MAVFFLAACSLEENPIIEGQTDPEPYGDFSDLTLKITFPSPESPITRAIGQTEENKIDRLDVLVFTDAGTTNLLDDTYAYKLSATPGTGHGFITDSVGTNGQIKKVPLSFKTSPQKQRIVLVANLPAHLRPVIDDLDESDEGVTTERDIIRQLKFNGASWRTAQNTGTGNYTPFPMFGQMAQAIDINYEHRDQIPSSIDINLIRSMAKINVGVDLNNTGSSGFGSVFTINKIYVCNASDSGYVAPHEDYLRTAPQPTHIGKTNPTVNRTGDIAYTFPAQPAKLLENTIYVPESDSFIQNLNLMPAFLVIDAQYKGSQRFYRIDFTNDARFIPLLRNHSYTLNIVGIKADGYATLAEAKASPLSTLNFAVSIEGTNSDINDISVYEGSEKYLLGISTREVVFDWERNWLGKPKSGGTQYYTLRVYSTYNNGAWTVAGSAPTGFTATKASSTELRIEATADNRTGIELAPTDSITIQAGFITKKIGVRQTAGANSALIKFAAGGTTSSVNIPLAYVKGARGNAIFNGKTMADFQAKVIWQEAGSNVSFKATLPTSGTVDAQHITVTATATAAGNKYANAVVALMWNKPEGVAMVGGNDPHEIVWSWHVWSMPEATELSTYVNGGDVNTNYHDPNQSLLMRRSLGKGNTNYAIKGMFYQWGRKDPFPSDSSAIQKADTLWRFYAETVNPNTIDNAIKKPTTFFIGISPQFDWMGTAQNDNLWSASGAKSYYDPCPEGWRVPPYYADVSLSPWQNDAVSYSTSVRNEYANNAGYISYTAWPFGNAVGCLWTATTAGATQYQARYTSIASTGVSYTQSFQRAAALSVRCVKDLARKY
ncbi:MAG: hypothetical protein LBQ65_04520 [Tannerellaceae bacterium]|nr:hypothetical protein [Tannerellaceae bacterium]